MLSAALQVLVAIAVVPPRDHVLHDTCDLVELNHFYDENGSLVFDQILFYDWDERAARYHVRAWRLVKHDNQIPQRDHARCDYVASWQDGERLRQVRAKSFRETWLQYDPELVEREFLPKEQRRELKGSKP